MKTAFKLASAALVGSALTAALAPLVAATPAGNAATGKALFLQCRACHTIGASEASGVGPNLNGVVGAKAATRTGYTFSPALAKSGLVWNEATLDRFLTKPTAVVPGTRMAFGGVAAPKARADLIAYLATLKGAKR